MKRRLGFSFLVVLSLLLTQLSSALAEDRHDDDRGDRREKYSAWGDQFWKYTYSLSPTEQAQFFALTGDCLHAHQTYGVFFLGGVAGGNRTCEIKAGTRLFFPLINLVYGEDPKYYDRKAVAPYVPRTFISWLDQALGQTNGTTAFASLDGVNLVTSVNQNRFYTTTVPSKALTYLWPCCSNPDGTPAIWQSFQGGYYLSLKLPARSQPYTLRFGGNISRQVIFSTIFSPGSLASQQFVAHPGDPYVVPFPTFNEDVTYTITVKS